MKPVRKFEFQLEPTIIANTPEAKRAELINVLCRHIDDLEEHILDLRQQVYDLSKN